MEGTADQARPAAEPAPESIAEGSPATPIGVLKTQKGKMHQLELRRSLQLEGPEYLAIEA